MKILVQILFLLFVCSSANAIQQEKIVNIALEYHSYMCEGYCTYIFEANEHTKIITRLPGSINQEKNSLTVKDRAGLVEVHSISIDEWKKMSASFSLDEITAMPYKNGCPGCDDGPVGTLKISTEQRIYTLTFEGPDPPASIAELTRLITAETFQE